MTQQPHTPVGGPNQAAPPSRDIYDQMSEANIFRPEHLPGFRDFLHGFSRWMVNTK